MKNKQKQNKDQIQPKMGQEKRSRKIKAEISKTSKSSHITRKRQQPDSSEQYLLPAQIPQSQGQLSIVTQGFENQLSKALIRIPYTLLVTQHFEIFNVVSVEAAHITIKVLKDNDNITVSARYSESSKVIQVQKQQIDKKVPNESKQLEQAKSNNFDKLEQSSSSQRQQFVYVVNIWGKYVYLSQFQAQNKLIKKVRKQLNATEDNQLIKFKLKNVNSDLFVYLSFRAEQYTSNEFNGLVNQGNTCYMNSYLQTLYHIPAFRNLVYEAQIQDQHRFPATLQDLFFNLRHSEKSVSPQLLVKSFGWGKKQASIQQDAQQFSCLFFQVLERKLNESAPKEGYRNQTMETLFKGQLLHYIRCTNVGTVIYNADFRRENFEQFIDLQLPIYPTLTQSLDAYTSQVHMQGDNKYRTDEHGQQEAFKGVRISYFPPILMIQLKRFEYSFQQQRNIKILTQLQYTEQFDFSPWSFGDEKQEYELYSVLVHEGARAESGHYYNFIKSDGRWFKLNDEIVQQVSKEKVFKYNFGGFHQSIEFDVKEMKVEKKFVESKTTAYMLVYMKKQLIPNLLKDQQIYPQWIMNKEQYKKELDQIKKNRKHFFHNIGFIDWEKQLKGKNCSDSGFLDEIILQKSKRVIEQIPKQSKISDWLIQEKIVQENFVPAVEKKKISKKVKNCSKSDPQIKFEIGIYVYYINDRQNLTGFAHKPHHTMEDLLKIHTDPYIFKAPFQIKKQDYLLIIKSFKVNRAQEDLNVSFTYDSLLGIPKVITYSQLNSILSSKYSPNIQILEQPLSKPSSKFNFYIDDLKLGLINLADYNGPIPFAVPNKNQLLVCVVEEIPSNLSISEELIYTLPKWYKNKKDTINLTVSEQKTLDFAELKEVNIHWEIPQLRRIIFQRIVREKKPSIESADNIVLKARLKKNSKVFTEVSEPEYSLIKDIVKIQHRIQFCYSNLSVESRLSQYELQFFYRFKSAEFSEPIQIIVDKQEKNEVLVGRIKTHKEILRYLNEEGYQQNEAQMLLFSKDRLFINDFVTDEGKVPSKGQLDTVLKKEKNAVVVIEGRNVLALDKEPTIQIKEEDVEPTVTILLHHVSQSLERTGTPRYFKVDRRIQLMELRNKVMDLIAEDTFGWQGKIYNCNPFKTRIRLYAKDTKKVVQLTNLQDYEQNRRLKIQQNFQNIRKKSKQFKNQNRKGSFMSSKCKEQTIQQGLAISQRAKSQIITNRSQIPQTEIGIIQDQTLTVNHFNKAKEAENEQVQMKNQDLQEELSVNQEVTNIQLIGLQTIYGVFPKVKVLKIQIIHNYLIKPNIALKLYVDD